jgi:hypothetical protein
VSAVTLKPGDSCSFTVTVQPLPPSALQARAARLWPHSPRNQAEWLRAVHTVRATARGWVADLPVAPEARRA